MSAIVISEFMDPGAVEALRAGHDVAYAPDLADDPDRLAGMLGDARALIVRNRTRVTAGLMEGAGHLECVGRLGVGLDNIDLEACRARGIAVYPATGANDLSVAEYVITAALVLLRRAFLATPAVIAGHWPRQALIGGELSGKTLGLVGYGAIARDVAARARALGVVCVGHDPFVPPDDAAWGETAPLPLEALLERADIVSLHTPLTEATRHLIDAAAIAGMKPRAILINAARGGIVEEAALIGALRDGRLGGAALDVFESEPLTAEAGARFAGLDNLLLTPHIAGVTQESNVRVSRLVARKVAAHLEAHR